jgi:hypothetical protein
VSEEELLAEALQEFADRAATPRPMAAAAWRAGRRRRGRTAAVSAGCAVAAVAVVALPVSGVLGLGHPQHRASDVTPALTLHMPIEVRQVATITKAPCPPNSGGVRGGTPPACFHLTGAAVSITAVTSLAFAPSRQGECGRYVVDWTLTRREGLAMSKLSRKLVFEPSPRNQVAIIIGGLVVAHPRVLGEVDTSGQICLSSRAQAEQIYQGLRGG